MQPRRKIDCTVNAALDTWARQRRRLFVEHHAPLSCVLGSIKDERTAAGEGDPRARQRWPEVFFGDGLAVQMIVVTLRETPRMVLSCYYLLRATEYWQPITAQATELGITKAVYWGALEQAECAVDSGLRLLAAFAPPARAPVNGARI